MAFAIVQTRGSSIPAPNLEYFTAGAAAITKGELLTLTAGLLVIATGAVTAKYIAAADALADATNVPVYPFDENQVGIVGYTGGTPVVGTAYDSDATGLLLNTADTTNPKLLVEEVDTTNSLARVRNIAQYAA